MKVVAYISLSLLASSCSGLIPKEDLLDAVHQAAKEAACIASCTVYKIDLGVPEDQAEDICEEVCTLKHHFE